MTQRCALVIVAIVGAVTVVSVACSGKGSSTSLIVYEASDGTASNIFTIDAQTSKTAQLTFGSGFDGNPAWSPDRKHIVFASNRDGPKNDLYLMDATGRNVSRITHTPDAAESSPKYSADGRRIAFVREDSEGWRVWMMQADGRDEEALTPAYSFAEFPAFSPDGTELYFAAIEKTQASGLQHTNLHIFAVGIDSKSVRTAIKTAGTDSCPHFSRDGKRLTYASSSAGGSEDHLTIFAHDAASADPSGISDAPLTDGSTRDDYPNPSPDDKRMVYVSHRDGNSELYVMDRDGSNQRRVTNTPELRENVPDW